MSFRRPRPSRISVSWEITEVRRAADAAQLLLDAYRHDGLGSDDARGVALAAASGVLTLTRERLTLLARSAQGALDPALLLTRANAVGELPADDEDVILAPWGDEERLRRARAEAERLERLVSWRGNTDEGEKEDDG